jgi:putative transposase
MNQKAFARIYRLGNLQVKRRRRRHRARFVRGILPRRATRRGEGWTLDFVADRLLHGRRIRSLTLMDEFSKGGLALEIAFSLPALAVVRVLDEVAAIFGYPTFLRVDNGPELASLAMLDWALEHDVQLLFIEPGKPTQNAFIESFDSRVREEFFNANIFRSLAEARLGGQQWSRK